MKLQRRRTPACPGCGGTRWSAGEINVRDAKYGVPGLWSFLRCGDCGLVYLDGTDACGVRRPVLLIPTAQAGGSLLDVGCGNGRFLTVMRMLGWWVHGIEPDQRSAEIARRSSGARIDSELDEELYPPAYFDVITMNHVLEHVADPVTVLRQCLRLCRPGGLVGIVVPNWGALGHRLFRRHWCALEPPRHAVMYEPATLERTLQRAGFDVQSVRTTSVREWATAWRKSWQYTTGRRSPRGLLAAWGALTALVSLVADDVGEEVVAWAQRPLPGSLPDRRSRQRARQG